MGNNLPDSSSLAEAILVGLARKRSTQGQLADHLKLSQPAIHRRMAGKVTWRISELLQVAEFLGVPVADLLVNNTKASA